MQKQIQAFIILLRFKKPDKNDYHNQLVSATAVIKFKKSITAI